MQFVYGRISDLIDGLFAGGSHPAYWRQEPYKRDFFKVFLEHQELHGDQIRQHLRETWLRSTKRSSEKADVMDEICSAWDEWKYALANQSE